MGLPARRFRLLVPAVLLVGWAGCLGDLGLGADNDHEVAEGGKGGSGGTGAIGDGPWPDGVPPDAPDGWATGGALGGGGTGPGGGGTGGAQCGGMDVNLNLVNPSCAACVAQSCCAEAAACALASECVAAVACITACPKNSPDCGTACVEQHPGGVDAGVPFAACVGQSCRWSCAHCGGVGSVVSLGSTCNACVKSHCCNEGVACGNDPDCIGWVECWAKCPSADAACIALCDQQFPGATAAGNALALCIDAQCQSAVPSANCRPCGGLEVTFGKSAECGTCIEQSCCAQASACANDGACVGWIDCALACPTGDSACLGACTAKYPSGPPAADPLLVCLGGVNPPCPC